MDCTLAHAHTHKSWPVVPEWLMVPGWSWMANEWCECCRVWGAHTSVYYILSPSEILPTLPDVTTPETVLYTYDVVCIGASECIIVSVFVVSSCPFGLIEWTLILTLIWQSSLAPSSYCMFHVYRDGFYYWVEHSRYQLLQLQRWPLSWLSSFTRQCWRVGVM